jgi:hypothetical protein
VFLIKRRKKTWRDGMMIDEYANPKRKWGGEVDPNHFMISS